MKGTCEFLRMQKGCRRIGCFVWVRVVSDFIFEINFLGLKGCCELCSPGKCLNVIEWLMSLLWGEVLLENF